MMKCPRCVLVGYYFSWFFLSNHILWISYVLRRPQNFAKLLLFYVVPVKSKLKISKISWPSQNIWTLTLILQSLILSCMWCWLKRGRCNKSKCPDSRELILIGPKKPWWNAPGAFSLAAHCLRVNAHPSSLDEVMRPMPPPSIGEL